MTRSRRLASGLRQASAGGVGVEQRLAELSEQAAILADAVREIASKKPIRPATDLEFWADAVRACIESHRRDLDARARRLA